MTLSLKLITIMLVLIGGTTNQTAMEEKAVKAASLTIQNLSKKWQLDKYKYLLFSEAPSEQEQDDYIHLKSDLTFESVSEGIKESGNWRLDAAKERIYLTQNGDSQALVFIVDNLSTKKLVLIIDDTSDADAKHLKIYFKI